jgi:hypothetical protein
LIMSVRLGVDLRPEREINFTTKDSMASPAYPMR